MKTMTKKTVSFFAATALALSTMCGLLTACDGLGGGDADPEVTGIEVTTAPTKVHYVLGEKFDTAGMVVSKVYDNDTKEAITEYTYSPNGALKLNDKKITIKYEDYTCTQNINVTNDIASISVVTQPTKTEYIAGEVFDPAGMTIKAKLENGTEEDAIEVTSEAVQYKTGKLVKSDEHFKMNYGGCDFYIDITVLHGAFVEAEAGQIANNKASKGSAAPDTSAITKDYENALGNVDDAQGHRGIDEGKNCLETGIASCYKGANGCTISGGRVDIRSYVYSHLEWTETTGGEPAKSGMIQNNHINFSKGGQMLYRLTADKAGKVLVTFKMANPHFEGPDSPLNSKAVETKLNEVIKFTVGENVIDIPDSVKLAAVDWTMYKSYDKANDYANKGNQDLYTGKLCKPIYYWQNVTVEINVEKGVNDFTVESIWDGDVKLDSISCNADADEITLNMNTQFKPQVVSGQLKVDDGKVLLGVIVDAQASNYTDDEVMNFLKLTNIKGISNTTYKDNNWANDKSSPWTTSKGDGGLGYEADPASYAAGILPKPVYTSVEKITEGDFEDCYCIWYDVTCTASNQVGVFKLSGLNYGSEYENGSWCQNDVLWDGEEDVSNNPLFAENGGYCYQVYCDTRMQYGSFQIDGKTLLLVIQEGSYTGENAVAKLCKKYIPGRTDNDTWLHA